ncbi:MAG: helix-turn-helix transcriptional regulator [Pseudomonadota bacterium]
MTHPVDIHVGRKLKMARAAQRMSQTDVARKLGLSFQQIQKYEIGSNRIAASRLYELSKILDVPTSYFFEGLSDAETVNALPTSSDDIASAIAAIKDPGERARIVQMIENASGQPVRKTA